MSKVEEAIRSKFKCTKCGHSQCRTKELAMTGSGLSKLLDIQHNHFLFVSCAHCGYVEVYDPNVLEGKKGQLSSVLDILFG
ncbi:zinc ribbon domain-containing protein [Fictibacillus barbaricus]|uniref:Nucleic-acid-binding Zn-ribbon protein n=1 Tax=Fictibacillus barbaricus TaxID=182136 RepID=A0ABU1TX02_9BACL|nr:zinc ribbon domain-containing protein [Fictibacillus barbaricus]MDR7071709.1 putative nucleic-acid-binding Zn-ribbon protein [Fictibacillus barbaricus]